MTTPEESAWLYHELGRCQLELHDYSKAVDYGKKSLNAARESCDQMWQLNASMLIAQAQSKHTQSHVTEVLWFTDVHWLVKQIFTVQYYKLIMLGK